VQTVQRGRRWVSIAALFLGIDSHSSTCKENEISEIFSHIGEQKYAKQLLKKQLKMKKKNDVKNMKVAKKRKMVSF
jgi:hypothetical protein